MGLPVQSNPLALLNQQYSQTSNSANPLALMQNPALLAQFNLQQQFNQQQQQQHQQNLLQQQNADALAVSGRRPSRQDPLNNIPAFPNGGATGHTGTSNPVSGTTGIDPSFDWVFSSSSTAQKLKQAASANSTSQPIQKANSIEPSTISSAAQSSNPDKPSNISQQTNPGAQTQQSQKRKLANSFNAPLLEPTTEKKAKQEATAEKLSKKPAASAADAAVAEYLTFDSSSTPPSSGSIPVSGNTGSKAAVDGKSAEDTTKSAGVSAPKNTQQPQSQPHSQQKLTAIPVAQLASQQQQQFLQMQQQKILQQQTAEMATKTLPQLTEYLSRLKEAHKAHSVRVEQLTRALADLVLKTAAAASALKEGNGDGAAGMAALQQKEIALRNDLRLWSDKRNMIASVMQSCLALIHKGGSAGASASSAPGGSTTNDVNASSATNQQQQQALMRQQQLLTQPSQLFLQQHKGHPQLNTAAMLQQVIQANAGVSLPATALSKQLLSANSFSASKTPIVDILPKEEFETKLNASCAANGVSTQRTQKVNQKNIDYYSLFYIVLDFGGFERVRMVPRFSWILMKGFVVQASQDRSWKAIAERMQIFAPISAPGALRKYYLNFLLKFEQELFPNAKAFKGANPRFIPPGIIGPEVEKAPSPPAAITNQPQSWPQTQLPHNGANVAAGVSPTAAPLPQTRQSQLPVSASNIHANPAAAPPARLSNPLASAYPGGKLPVMTAPVQPQPKQAAQRPSVSKHRIIFPTNKILQNVHQKAKSGSQTAVSGDMDTTSKVFQRFGGLDVDKLSECLPEVKKVAKTQIGPVDLYNIKMSLKSAQDMEITYGLNVLTVLSNDHEVVLRFRDFNAIGHAVVTLLKDSIEEFNRLCTDRLSDEFVPLRKLLHYEILSSTCVNLVSCSASALFPSTIPRFQLLLERISAILMVLRNLSLVPENQHWLGSNTDFLHVLVSSFRICPFQTAENIQNDCPELEIPLPPPSICSDIEEEISSSPEPFGERILFSDAPTLCLEIRRAAFAVLLNIGLYAELPSLSAAKTVVNVLSDALTTHVEFLEAHKYSASLSSPWAAPASSVFFGADLQPIALLEGFTKLAVNVVNGDFIAQCQSGEHNINDFLSVCVGMLPQDGGYPTVISHPDDLPFLELLLSCLYNLVVILDGTGAATDRRIGSVAAQKQSTLAKAPSFVPILMSLMRLPTSLPTVDGSLAPMGTSTALASFEAMCLKASRVLLEAVRRGGHEARQVVKKHEAVLVGMGIGGANAGVTDEVCGRVSDILFLVNDED
ncbi:hypothetical protein HDU83_000688 [Entophlyctis luteolus]|nr:hypothetical protein HDU83_000688 [Entophlyctis luteolus]